MIVSCSACSARYRIDPHKIKGRGAKITCPRCSHKFVVYKDQREASSAEPPKGPMRSTSSIGTRDFRRVGVTWRVRKAIGVTYSFHDLGTLEKHIEAGRVEGRDVLSYDARTWVPIDSLDDLGAYFEDIWRKAERGEIAGPTQPRPTMDDEAEAPTTIMGHGHALMDDIRKAVAEATTPPPSPHRTSDPYGTPSPPPNARGSRGTPHSNPAGGYQQGGRSSSPYADPPSDDPTTFSRRERDGSMSLTPSTSDVRGHTPSPPDLPGNRSRTDRTGHGGPTPRPARASTGEQGSQDLDNTVVLVTAIVAIVVVILVMGVGLWWAGLLRFGSTPGTVLSLTAAQAATYASVLL